MTEKNYSNDSNNFSTFDASKTSSWFKDGNFRNHIINEKNISITSDFIEGVLKKYNLKHKVKNLDNFQLAMVHISYINRSTLTEKTAKLLKDVIPIETKNIKKAIPLKDADYGTLEFLGDAVIHLAITKYLVNRFKNREQEGFLTKLRTKIERAEMLSILAKKLNLQKYAIVARNIEQSGGRLNNTHLTEDIFEAFIGALSLEAPEGDCSKFIISIIEKEIDMAELINRNDNYKDRLMQYFHQMKWGEPKYNEDQSLQKNIKEGCQEIRSFTVFIKNPDGDIIGIGEGNSKVKSEQNAAHNALIEMNVINDNDDESDYYGEYSSDEDSDDDSDDYFE
jgi:ribonuclease III